MKTGARERINILTQKIIEKKCPIGNRRPMKFPISAFRK